jgi:redox-sensitive bicupin YhaK (pirin superfamily)
MSGTLPANEPECIASTSPSVDLVIAARPRDIGGFAVRRAVPSMQRRLVGPFVFFDHMGPARFSPGEGLDVRPHPHIGLATVTYLFEGAIVHRDSLGSDQPILPGDVNWMLAGRGIVHSERTGQAERARGPQVHGIQSWVALPLDKEEVEPSFEHHSAASIPRLTRGGVSLDVIAGTAFGLRSPVSVLSPTLYVHAQLEAGATLAIDDEHEERGIYVVEGTVGCDGDPFPAGTMILLRPGVRVTVGGEGPARLMLVGGARLAGDRHVFWNFVSSSKERIEKAKGDWKEERFPKVPGDAIERVPLPD